jgi:exosome complex exonuclease RRP6
VPFQVVQQDVVETKTDAEAETPGDEIPFIPAPLRQAKTVIDDAIVVVGQMKQKKRKRPKQTPFTSQEADPSHTYDDDDDARMDGYTASGKKDDTPAQEPFDFASVPNILDAIPTEDGPKPRKKKKQQRQEGECSN